MGERFIDDLLKHFDIKDVDLIVSCAVEHKLLDLGVSHKFDDFKAGGGWDWDLFIDED